MLGVGKAVSTKAYQLLNTGTITSTGSQSYTIPLGTQYLEIEMWGAGGGGAGRNVVGSGRSASNYAGAGGGGGSYLKKTYYGAADMQVSDTLNFTVGAGGAAGGANTAGSAGGHTTLDTHKRSTTAITTFSNVRAGSGGGGAVGNALDTTANGGNAGSAVGGDINTNGNAGADVTGSVGSQSGSNGGDGADPDGGDGGNGALFGFGLAGPAQAGTAPGGGGGGGNVSGIGANNVGKAGGNGKVIVKAYG